MAQVPKRPLYHVMDGMHYPAMFSAQCFRESMTYQTKPNDIYINTYPKCGTTWLQYIALYIFRKGNELIDTSSFVRRSPFVDLSGLEGMANMPRPGAFKTHLPYVQKNNSSGAKYIFALREPKACCASFYRHTKSHPGFDYWDGKFDDFFELFMSGEVEYNDYFDHLMSWYPHRNDSNVFYTTYEKMKTNKRDVVVSLAKFLGEEYIDAIEKDNKVLNNIMLFSGYEYMQKNVKGFDFLDKALTKSMLEDPKECSGVKHSIKFIDDLNIPESRPKQVNMNKNWEHYFSGEQTDRLNAKFLEKTSSMDVQNWFQLV